MHAYHQSYPRDVHHNFPEALAVEATGQALAGALLLRTAQARTDLKATLSVTKKLLI